MEEIYRVGGHLDLAITLRDDIDRDKSGRVYLDQFCSERGIPLLKAKSVNSASIVREVQRQHIDWLFIIGWSQIAKPAVLSAPRHGCVGIHPTLLPQGRGRAPIPWAIIKGLPETGVTLFKLDEGVDTGPIIAQLRLPIAPDETATTLYDRVMDAHRALIGQAWPMFEAGRVVLTPQDPSRATDWPKRTPADGAILNTMTVADVDRLVRATTHPYPGAFYDEPGSGRRIRIWSGSVERPSSHCQPAYQVRVADGAYYATDFVHEPCVTGQ